MTFRKKIFHLVTLFLMATSPVWGEFGDVEWSYQTGGIVLSSPVLDSSGNVYFGSRDGSVYSVDAGGALRWSRPTGDWIESSPALSADETTVYIGSWDDKLYALDTSDGSVRWTFQTDSLIFASPAIGSDGAIYFGSSDGFVYAVNPDGSKRWEYFHGGELDSSPAVDRDGNVYLGTIDGKVVAIDSSGLEIWTILLDVIEDRDSRVVSSPSLSDDGTLYVGSGNHFIYSIDVVSGLVNWKYETQDKVDTTPVFGVDGSIICGCYDGNIYALSSGGFLNWSNFIGDIFMSTPSVDSLGRIYVGAYVGQGLNAMIVLSPEGIELWSTLVDDYIDSSPCLAPDGTVYFGSFNGNLYAVEGGASLSDGEWSMFRRSNRGTSNLAEYSIPSPGREKLVNISLRGKIVGTTDLIIPGFVIVGDDAKRGLVRAVGPSLAPIVPPSEVAGLIGDARVDLFQSVGGAQVGLGGNDDWGDAPNKAEIETESIRIGALDLIESSKDSAILRDFQQGAFTAIATGVNDDAGVTLVELYDADILDTDTKLVNVSMRGPVGIGADIMIAGFVIDGSRPKRLLLRAVGKGLETTFGLPSVLGDTTMMLFQGSDMIALNDNWYDSPEKPEIVTASLSAGAFDLVEGDGDSAMVVWLEPGAYTLWVIGVAQSTGIALAEIYDLSE